MLNELKDGPFSRPRLSTWRLKRLCSALPKNDVGSWDFPRTLHRLYGAYMFSQCLYQFPVGVPDSSCNPWRHAGWWMYVCSSLTIWLTLHWHIPALKSTHLLGIDFSFTVAPCCLTEELLWKMPGWMDVEILWLYFNILPLHFYPLARRQFCPCKHCPMHTPYLCQSRLICVSHPNPSPHSISILSKRQNYNMAL